MTTKPPTTTSRVERIARAPTAPLVDALRFDGSIVQMMARPVEIWLHWHNDLLKAVEPATLGWLQRRRDGVDAALAALERLARCADLGEAASIQSDWIDGAIKRLNSDMAALTEQAITLSQEAATVTRSVTQLPKETQPSAKRQPVEREAPAEAAA